MDLLTITHFLNGFLMIAMPIILGIYFVEKFHLGWKIWLVGAVMFIISQLIHIPFNIYALTPFLKNIQSSAQGIGGSIAVAILLGLSAALFEETARYAMFRWWLKGSRSWRNAILAGAGHGGIEAILLGILVLVTYVNLMAYRNVDLSQLNLTIDQLAIARQQVATYWTAPWYATMLGAVERLFTIPFHIAASVLVLQVFTRSPGLQFGWLGLAVLYHAALDAGGVFIAGHWGAYAAEAFLGVTVLLDVLLIFTLRQPEPEAAKKSGETLVQVPAFTPTEVEETSENLGNTRYQ